MIQMRHGWSRAPGDSLVIYFSNGFSWTEHRLRVNSPDVLEGRAKEEGDATAGLGSWLNAVGRRISCPRAAGEPVAAPDNAH
jgi:hypothetical protein